MTGFNRRMDRTNKGIIANILFLLWWIVQGESLSVRASSGITSYPEDMVMPPIAVSGQVMGEGDKTLPGAAVWNDFSNQGTISDAEGKFSLSVPKNTVLSVSFLGYEPRMIFLGDKDTVVSVVLTEKARQLEEVVVTALGLPRLNVSLPYTTVQLAGDAVNRVKDPNFILSLSGKSPGLQIHKSASGLGGSAKVILRGNRSVAGNNQPLYVIDGVPILNTSNEQPYTTIGGTADGGNRDGGDGISNLNPADIETITVLTGASAAALYGGQAANGVILITTKKGKKGIREISFSTQLTVEKAICLPEFQHSYGVSDGIESWGKKQELPSYDNAGDFFRRGITSITSLSIRTGNENIQNYFSYANTAGRGIVDKNNLMRHNLMLRESTTLFGDRLKLDGSVAMMLQKMKNRPVPGGFYMNPLVGLYRFPRGMDISGYKNQFEIYNPDRLLYVQRWHSDTQDFEQNPYWIVNRILSEDTRTRAIVTVTAEWQVYEWLKIRARGSMDYVADKMREKFYASTAPALAGENGRYIEYEYGETLSYGDVIARFDKTVSGFSLHAALGGSVNNKVINSIRYDSKTASLKYANVFNLANINMTSGAYLDQQIDARRVLQSVFFTGQAGYRDQVYLDISARNDWSSTLAFTSHEKKGFFYPSAGLSWIMHKTFRLPSWITFAKLRGVWSRVGNDIPLFITNPVAHIGAGGEIRSIDAAPFTEMKPEMTNSVECGTDWKFLSDRLSISATWYQTHTLNQFFKLPAQTGDPYAYRYVNAGNIRNRGLEISLGGTPVSTGPFRWKTQVVYSFNRNKVLKLHDQLHVFLYGPFGFSSTYAMKLVEGGSFGDIYGKAFRRDENNRILYETEGSKAGLPQVTGEGNTIKVGNANPLFTLSWNHEFSYGNLTFSFLLDGRFGGDVLSQTQADMDQFGVTAATARARDAGAVWLEGHKVENVKDFYKLVVGGRAGVTEYYMYDATNIRLRELSVGYTLPRSWLRKDGVFRSVGISFVARNLFFIYKPAPFDPELVLSTGNDNQGIDSYGMPTTRSMGFQIKCEF